MDRLTLFALPLSKKTLIKVVIKKEICIVNAKDHHCCLVYKKMLSLILASRGFPDSPVVEGDFEKGRYRWQSHGYSKFLGKSENYWVFRPKMSLFKGTARGCVGMVALL